MTGCTCGEAGSSFLIVATRQADGSVLTRTWMITDCVAADAAGYLGEPLHESLTTSEACKVALAAVDAHGGRVDLPGYQPAQDDA